MFHTKTPKKEEATNSVLTFHLKTSYPDDYWYNGYLNVVSIDPGITNFGFRIETRYADGRVITIEMSRYCFQKSIQIEGYYNSLYQDVTSWLDNYKTAFYNSHVIIIERQLPENYQSLRLSQHLVSYFISLLLGNPIEPLLVEIDPKAKYKYLSAPTGYNKKALKEWGTSLALQILEERKDTSAIALIYGTKGIRGQKKQDDLSDTIIQIEAFWKIFNIPIIPLKTTDNSLK